MGLLRTLHTLRYLKPVQIVHRVGRVFRSIPTLAELSPELYSLRRRAPQPGASVEQRPFDGRSFRFLGQQVPFTGDERWRPSGASPLWLYKLHYFQYLDDLEPAAALGLIEDWIVSNPAPAGVGWQPYPLSMRIREWLEWLLGQGDLEARTERGLLRSLVHQTAALEAQLEYEHLANHLLENAVTLCWAGSSLDGPDAERWLNRGLEILRHEVAVQLLPDGSHDERSPMYQAWIAEALLRLAAVAETAPGRLSAEVAEISRRAGTALLRSLDHLIHPDGDYALLNDTALGEAPSHAALAARFPAVGEARSRPVEGVWDLPAAGYMGWRRGGGYMVFDAGDIAPDHNTAHAHADTLSFELSHRGRRLVTDTGTCTYSPGARRAYDRGTAAHNTIEVDGRDQSEVWAAHRCGRRAKVTSRRLAGDEEASLLEGAYRGPTGSLSGLTHRRRLTVRGDELAFRDSLRAPGSHRAALRLHLAPGFEALGEAGSLRIVAESGDTVARLAAEEFSWRVTSSPYHPRFGGEVERVCLEADLPFRDRLAVHWRLRLY